MIPRIGSEKAIGLGMTGLGSGLSSSTKQLSGLWLPLLEVSREVARGAVLGFPDVGSGLSSTYNGLLVRSHSFFDIHLI